jgi:hypothetical protein
MQRSSDAWFSHRPKLERFTACIELMARSCQKMPRARFAKQQGAAIGQLHSRSVRASATQARTQFADATRLTNIRIDIVDRDARAGFSRKGRRVGGKAGSIPAQLKAVTL